MKTSDTRVKASDLLVKALENEGVEYVFGVPGEENLDFLESLRTSNIRLILTRHEQGAGFMAATYGRLTGKAGVCLATLGPGATNLVTAAAYAHLGAMPMCMITGQKPIKASKQGRFQIVDVVAMMRPITKFAKQIVNGHTIPSLVREAFRSWVVTPAEVAWAFCVGVDFVVSARGFMFALGCIQALKCNKNTCPTGITTHDRRLQRGLDPEIKSVRVKNFVEKIRYGTGIIAHSCGVAHPRALKRYHCRIVQGDGKSVPLYELYPVPDVLPEHASKNAA